MILPDGRELWHTPTPDTPALAKARLIDFWNSATISLHIVDYSFNLPDFETVLPALKARGVAVHLTLDKSQSKGPSEVPIIQALQTAGIEMVIGTSSLHGIIHDKFSIVDGRVVSYGSFNYTNAAGKEDNFFFIDSTPEVVSYFMSARNSITTWILQNESMINLRKDIMVDYKDVAIRAAKTFAQVFVAALLASAVNFTAITSVSDGKKLLLSALVAAVSVVWNTVLVPVFKPVTAKLGL